MQASLLSELIQSIVDAPGRFVDIALADPIAGVLILIGAVLVGISSAVFGYLSLGAAASLVFRPGSGRSPPQEGR
jgi:urea transporter